MFGVSAGARPLRTQQRLKARVWGQTGHFLKVGVNWVIRRIKWAAGRYIRNYHYRAGQPPVLCLCRIRCSYGACWHSNSKHQITQQLPYMNGTGSWYILNCTLISMQTCVISDVQAALEVYLSHWTIGVWCFRLSGAHLWLGFWSSWFHWWGQRASSWQSH